MNKYSKILWGTGDPILDHIPKTIWLYWEGRSSEVVNRCIDKLKSTLLDYEIIILNNKNLHQYLPNIIASREDLPIANYSDIIRLDLLRTHGGIWMDASILITQDFSWLDTVKSSYKPELIGFYSDLFTTNYGQPIIETWFLAATKNSQFIRDWYNEYEKCYTSKKPHQYYTELKNNKEQIQGLYDDISADYLICYLSAIKIMLESKNYRILMYSANDTGHLYKFKLKFTLKEFFIFFLKDKTKDTSDLPFLIKYINTTRTFLDTAINRGQYTKESLLYKISPDKHYRSNKLLRSFNYLYYIVNNLLKKYIHKINTKN
ncbi:glycosyltransferase family 32 protein [Chryseobacterium sp. T1]